MRVQSGLNKTMAILLCLVFYFNNETLSNNLCTFVEQPTKYAYGLLFLYIIFGPFPKRRILLQYGIGKFVAIVLLLLFTAFSFISDSGFTNGYVLLLLAVVCGIIITQCISIEAFSILYVKFMVVISCASLFGTYLLKYIAPNLGGMIPVVRNSAGVPFYNMYLCYVYESVNFYRNFGIYREPGAFAFFLCLSFVFLIINKKKYKLKDYSFCFVVLLATLISTFSTSGYLGFFIILLWLCIIKKDLNWKIVVISGICLITLSAFSNVYIENPLLKLSVESSSFQYRWETIDDGSRLMINKPLGYGILRGIAALSELNSLRYYHNTSTFIGAGVYFGVPFLIIMILGLFKVSKRHFGSSLLFLSFVVLLNSELLIYNPFVYILMMYGFSRENFE